MTTLKVTFKKYETLIQQGYTLDMIYLLKMIQQEIDVQKLCQETPKISLLCQTLLRKQLITSEWKLTKEGNEILAFFDQPSKEKLVKHTVEGSLFEQWWKEFPGTDTFTHSGKTFKGARGLRVNKEECKIKFDKIVNEGEHTAEDLINAMKYDVQQKKDNSVKTNTNRLTYMQSTITYLNQRSYEPFIELIKQEGFKPIIEQQHTFDI